MPQLSPEVKEDATQAIAGAAWRANGDLLMERQPLTVANWLRAFEPPVDSSTQLQEYCARLKVDYNVDYERRGPDHQLQMCATITFEVDGRPRCRGPWRAGKTPPAKQAAAATALNWVFGHDEVDEPPTGDRLALLRALFLAELRTVDPPERRVHTGTDIVAGTLGVDLLAAADYDGYLRWVRARAQLVPPGSGDSDRGSPRSVLRRGVDPPSPGCGAAVECPEHTLPRRGGTAAEARQVRTHLARGPGAGRLALLEDLLTMLRRTDRRWPPSTTCSDRHRPSRTPPGSRSTPNAAGTTSGSP